MQAGADRRALIVAGPTCSGKSALALAIAERLGGAIINADSMQVYRELRIVTARPSAEDEARAPHLLYGVRSAAESCDVARWRAQALNAMETARARGLMPILCGGTGLYLAALTHGLAAIPDPGPEARAEGRALLAEIGPAALHARLASVDPETAARLRPGGSQRIQLSMPAKLAGLSFPEATARGITWMRNSKAAKMGMIRNTARSLPRRERSSRAMLVVANRASTMQNST